MEIMLLEVIKSEPPSPYLHCSISDSPNPSGSTTPPGSPVTRCATTFPNQGHVDDDAGMELITDTQPVEYAPCSSLEVLMRFLSSIMGMYGVTCSIFKNLTPGDVIRWMLASKDMAEILSQDREYIMHIVRKYCTGRPSPIRDVKCNWCKMYISQCAGCFKWDHNVRLWGRIPSLKPSVLRGYKGGDHESPRLTQPAQRLYRYQYCANNCKPPASVFDGRCLCNTKNNRRICQHCMTCEAARIGKIGLPLLKNEVEGVCFNCDDSAETVVSCCSWCGLVAVDAPPPFPPLDTVQCNLTNRKIDEIGLKERQMAREFRH